MNLSNAWKNFISIDHMVDELNNNVILVSGAVRETRTSKTLIPILLDHKPLVMISRPSMGSDAQITTLHTHFGSPVLLHKKSFIGLSGLVQGAPVELEMSGISKYATNTPVTDLDALLAIQSKPDLDLLQVVPDSNEKIRNVAILVPKLAAALHDLQDFDMKTVLITFIKTINGFEKKAIETIPIEVQESQDETAEATNERDEVIATIREEIKLEFWDALLTIWKMAFDANKIDPVRYLPICDAYRLEYLLDTAKVNPPAAIRTLPETPLAPTPDQTKITDWATSMSKVAEVWEREISRKEKNDQDHSDKNKESWENLSKLQRNTILLAATENGLVTPTKPTDIMLVVLRSGTGARALTILHHEITARNCIVNLDRGFVTAMKNGLFLSQPTENHLNYYSPAFTAPVLPDFYSSSTDPLSSLRIAEQAALGKVSNEDIASMTKQTVKYPKTYGQLVHTIKNFRALTGILYIYIHIYIYIKIVYLSY